jgi:hypothetical protein
LLYFRLPLLVVGAVAEMVEVAGVEMDLQANGWNRESSLMPESRASPTALALQRAKLMPQVASSIK